MGIGDQHCAYTHSIQYDSRDGMALSGLLGQYLSTLISNQRPGPTESREAGRKGYHDGSLADVVDAGNDENRGCDQSTCA